MTTTKYKSQYVIYFLKDFVSIATTEIFETLLIGGLSGLLTKVYLSPSYKHFQCTCAGL